MFTTVDPHVERVEVSSVEHQRIGLDDRRLEVQFGFDQHTGMVEFDPQSDLVDPPMIERPIHLDQCFAR